MPEPLTLGSAAIMAAGSAAAAGISAGATAVRNKKQYKYTKKLNDDLYQRQLDRDARQQSYARELSDYEYQRNLEQWHRENAYNTPSAQMERYRDAGLNPHLIYSQTNPSASSPSYVGHMADASQPSMQNTNVENTASEWIKLGEVLGQYQSYLSTAELIDGQRLDNIGKDISNINNSTLLRGNVVDLFNKFVLSNSYVDNEARYIYTHEDGVENHREISSDMRGVLRDLKGNKNIMYQLQKNANVQSHNLGVVSSFQRTLAAEKTDLITKALKRLKSGQDLTDVFNSNFNTSMMLLNTMEQNSDVFSAHLPIIGTVGKGLSSAFKGIKSLWQNRKKR